MNQISMQRVNMQRVGSIVMAVVLGLAAGQVNACSVPAHPTFEQSLANATSVFIFRLDQAQYRREDFGLGAHSAWVEGKIALVQNLYGDPTRLVNITFSSAWCGAVRLVVGRHYLIATHASGNTIELVAEDASLFDVEDFYNPEKKTASLQSMFILPVIRAIYAVEALPTDFPPRDIAGITVPPLPPPAVRKP